MVQLISEKSLKDFSLLDENLSWNYIQPTLTYIQDFKMTELLGKELYDDIKESVRNKDMSAEYKELLDNHIKFVILWNVMGHIQIPLNNKFRNQGSTNSENEDGRLQTLSEIQYTKEFYINTASFYEKQMIKYIRCNSSKFPLFKCTTKTYNCPITL